ncbi:MAG: alpha/beta hydrolase [Myxococcota bacterium]|nr:alpha/beta hydrolase [Myxococcota bacterium]
MTDKPSFAVGSDGTRLFVRTRTSGHSSSAVHAILNDGVLCDGFIWKYLWDELAPIVPLVHWHYRGHGRSATPADPDRIDIAAHADDLSSVRRHVGDPPCVLFGHSMGCQVALEEYRRHPEKVRGLVLLCGSFGNVTSTFHGVPVLELILPKLLALARKSPEMVRAVWSRLPPLLGLKIALKAGEIDPDRVHAEDILPYLAHMTHVDFPMFLRMLHAAGEHSASDILSRIDVPVLVVAGERDTFTPAFLAKSMAEAIPRGELLLVPRGSHVAPIEQPELVNAGIKKFLRDRVL